MKFLKAFIEDCKYYDPKNKELKTILKKIKVKNKRIIDIGAGIGRLSFPLSKYAKEVIALDYDKRFKEYYKKHKRKNLIFINKSAEEYLTKDNKFDIFLIAWPTIDFKFIDLLNKSMSKNSLIIFITCDNNSDFETIIDRVEVFEKDRFNKDIINKKKFIKRLEKEFQILKKEKIKTDYVYPSKKIALKSIENSLKLWFKINIKKESKLKLIELIESHTLKNNKVKFEEELFFMILKLK